MGKHAFWTASFQCLAKSLLKGYVVSTVVQNVLC